MVIDFRARNRVRAKKIQSEKRRFRSVSRSEFVRPQGLEPRTYCLEGSCSIHLSYGRNLNFPSHLLPLLSLPSHQSTSGKSLTASEEHEQERKEMSCAAPSRWQDSNLRPSAPKADALTGLRYTSNSIQ